MTPRNVFFLGLGLIALALVIGTVMSDGQPSDGNPLLMVLFVVGAFFIVGAGIARLVNRR